MSNKWSRRIWLWSFHHFEELHKHLKVLFSGIYHYVVCYYIPEDKLFITITIKTYITKETSIRTNIAKRYLSNMSQQSNMSTVFNRGVWRQKIKYLGAGQVGLVTSMRMAHISSIYNPKTHHEVVSRLRKVIYNLF
jgi:hypothetical protein